MPAFQKRLLFVSFWKFCFLMFWVMLGSKLKMMMKMMMNCFCGMVGRRKTFRFISSRDMSEILTITNLRHATSRVWICAESEFRLSWMKLCSSDNYYTTVLLTVFHMVWVSRHSKMPNISSVIFFFFFAFFSTHYGFTNCFEILNFVFF